MSGSASLRQRFEIAAELPAAGDDIMYLPRSGPGHGRDGMLLRLFRNDGSSWLAMVAGSFVGDVAGPIQMPDGQHVYAAGLILNAEGPDGFHQLAVDPVTAVHRTADGQHVLFLGFTEIEAHGPAGRIWRSERLVLDDLEIERIEGGLVHCRGSDLGDQLAGDKSHVVVLDLMTGRVVSGRRFQW